MKLDKIAGKKLEKIIEGMVRRSLTKIFCEMRLENIVESVLTEKLQSAKQEMKQSQQVQQNQSPTPKYSLKNIDGLIEEREIPAEQPSKTLLMEKLGISEDEWKNIYGTIDNDNPILTNTNVSIDNRELVSESALRSKGLFKDYSRFIK